MQRVKVQIPYGEYSQLFRYQFESTDQRFNELRVFISQKVQSSDFSLRYKDDEGEMITIGNNDDVAEALETAESMNAMLKIFVDTKNTTNEPAILPAETSVEIPSEPIVEQEKNVQIQPDAEMEVAPINEFDLPKEVNWADEKSQLEIQPVADVAPRVDPMERVFVALEELMKVYRKRFGVLLLIELNKILQTRDIHPKNYPAEIAMIINTQNEFSEVLQNPLYLDVVGPALFKVMLPDDFIVRVNASASLLKSLDARSISEYADTMIGTLCINAFERKHEFTLRAVQPAFDFQPSAMPADLDPLEVPPPAPKQSVQAQEKSRGLLSSMWSGWGVPEIEEPVPFVEPDAPVVAPDEPASTDFDLLNFVTNSLENARDEEKASEERLSALEVTPASHTAYCPESDEDIVLLADEEESAVEQQIDEMVSDVDAVQIEEVDADDVSEMANVELELEEDLDDEDEVNDVKEEMANAPRGRQLTHPNSLCSLCGMQPIKGLRYKCLICTDMNLCAECERSNDHDRSHPVIKFSTATQRLYAPHELSGLKDLIEPSYHTIFFTDIPSERNHEDAMNMSTYSSVSAASLNPLLMMRYMAESFRNPAALSRILDPIPNEDGESVSSSSEFEVDVTVEEDGNPQMRFDEPEASAEPEIEFPQDDDFEVAVARSVDEEEVDFDVKVDAEPELVVPEPVIEAAPERVEAEAAPVGEVGDQQAPLEVAVVSEPVPPPPQQEVQVRPPAPMPAQPATQVPQRGPVVGHPVAPPPYPQQMYNYQYGNRYYAPGMPYPQAGYGARQPPVYPSYYQYPQQQGQQMYTGPPQQPAIPQQPRVPVVVRAPVVRPPPPPVKKQEDDELADDFMLESQPDVPRPRSPILKPPMEEPKVVVAEKVPAEVPPKKYVPPVVSNLPAYPQLRPPAAEEKSAPPEPATVAVAEPSAVEENTGDNFHCYCGVALVQMPVGDLGSVVQCDVCNVKVTKGEVYHCFEQANHGSGGYDLCMNCAQDQINASRSERLPQTTQTGAPSATSPMEPSAPPSAPPSGSSAPVVKAPTELDAHRKFKFFNGLISLNEMGIGDVETNKKLLKIHKGNVSAVMQQYFDGNVSGYHY